MIEKYYKYQSLGNDFILLDFLEKSASEIDKILLHDNWPQHVRKKCDRCSGVGADGVLIIKNDEQNNPTALLFNSDGSNGEKCLNGLRCIAHYLYTQKHYPKDFQIYMAGKPAQCIIVDDTLEIILNVGVLDYKIIYQLEVDRQQLTGHVIDAGNPHFVILQQTSLAWLKQHGKLIEQHPYFPKKTNVEFVWKNEKETQKNRRKTFEMLVYERGCGITLACGSGAAATTLALNKTQQIDKNEKIIIKMPGGNLLSYITENNDLIQQASAQEVKFK